MAKSIGKGPLTSSTKRRKLDEAEIASFDHITEALSGRVQLVRTNLLPPAADGMTIGRYILLRGGQIDRHSTTLLAHELVHVRQFAEMGPMRFLTSYVGAYLKNLARTRNHRQAYLDIPHEVEARQEAGEWAKRKARKLEKG